MPSTRVGRRGQITLPKHVRELLRISEGDRIVFVTRDGDVILQPIRTSLRDHRGSVSVEGEQDFDAIRSDARRTRAERLRAFEDENPDAG